MLSSSVPAPTGLQPAKLGVSVSFVMFAGKMVCSVSLGGSVGGLLFQLWAEGLCTSLLCCFNRFHGLLASFESVQLLLLSLWFP